MSSAFELKLLALAPWIIAVLAGLAAALVGHFLADSAAEVPEEDRTYKDPPPIGFRLLWWPIQWIAFYLRMILPAKLEDTLRQQLRNAGFEYTIDPAQFLAAKILFGGMAGGGTWWILSLYPFNIPKFGVGVAVGSLVFVVTSIWLRDQVELRRQELRKTLPFFLDLITLCVEAGLNLQGAIGQAVIRGPKGVLRDELQRVLRDIRAGKTRAESLREFAARLQEPAITNLVATLIQAERMGMTLGPVLRAQADQRRNERFQRAEKLAMQAPVKMLFPLIFFIMPCAAIVLLFPIAMKLLHSGFF